MVIVLIVTAVFTSSRVARLIRSLYEICILIVGISSGNKRDGLIRLFREQYLFLKVSSLISYKSIRNLISFVTFVFKIEKL